jgi:dihydrofolate synthase/folylpolyglutamate synthase
MSYQDTINYLYNLQKYGIKFGLENTNKLMGLMDNPYLKFISIHIAGTNGKGSVSAMLASVLQEAGYKVGLYTSPHLISFTERIRINGREISENKVIELADEIRNRLSAIESSDCKEEEFTPTFFEFTTTIAFTYFAEEKIDIAVIETGMGGRLDSTNVIKPLVSVITPIDHDHKEFLGDTIQKIAYEKAGIIKDGGIVVSSPQNNEAMDVLKTVAREKGARLFAVDKDTSVAEKQCNLEGCIFDYKGIKNVFKDLLISLAGRHQMQNAATALLALEALGLKINEAAIREGLRKTKWPGRLEIVERESLIILDGAHNPAAAKRLREFLSENAHNKKIILVLGILADKDITGIISELSAIADNIILTKPEYYRASDPEKIKELIKGHPVTVINNIPDAIMHAKEIAMPDDIICITGSLFTVGEAKAFLSNPSSVKLTAGLRG